MKKPCIALCMLSLAIYAQVKPLAYVNSGALSNGVSCGIGEIFVMPSSVLEKPTEPPKEIVGKEPGIDKIQVKGLIASPNPTTGIVNINTELDIRMLSVYSSEGKWIMDVDMKKNRTVDLANLPSGLYSFIFCEPNFQSIKIIKR
ncbi:MAG: T9SS type A sorting domain-containing protein [Phycisphaerales bacterium]